MMHKILREISNKRESNGKKSLCQDNVLSSRAETDSESMIWIY